jgi:hypothetical protein
VEAQIDAVLSRFVARANEVRNQLNSQAWGPSKALDEVSHATVWTRHRSHNMFCAQPGRLAAWSVPFQLLQHVSMLATAESPVGS